MWSYLLLLISVFILLGFFIIYIVSLTYRAIKKHIKSNSIAFCLSFTPLFLFLIGFFIDFVNAVVVDIHLIIIILFMKAIVFIIKKITKKSINEYLIFTISIILTTLLLTYGYFLAYHVVRTDYEVHTTKNIDTNNFRIVQISDSHLGTTFAGKEFSKYMEKISNLSPDVVVVTGDFVDDNTSYKDMITGAKSLGKIKTKYGVYFVYGNHDKGYYNNRSYTGADIRAELIKNNVKILEDSFVSINRNIILVGRQDDEVASRASVVQLLNGVDKDKYIIMLDHQPNDYKNEKNNADLVLSGHTHGGQLFPLGQIAVWLGVNDNVYGLQTRGKTTFIVNSGISDWAIKFKTGTIAEYTVIDVKK